MRNNQGVNGGGIRSAGTLIVERTTINNNAASSSGGGIYIGGGSVTIVDSTLDANTAAGSGGGILNDRTLAIFNSTLTGNFANLNGGAIAQLSSNDTATLKNVTVTLNRSDADGNASGIGGGIYGGQTKLENTIVAGNLRGTAPDELSTTLIHPSTHNLIGDAATAGGLSDGVDGNRVGVDPRLGPLANHGGPTRTHSLLLGSPAIDAGDGSLAVGPDSNPLLHDQRGPGYPRLVDGNGRGEVAVDIGAFESPLQLPLVQSIVINDGATQRSSLKTLRVTFNTQVDIDQVTSDPFQFVDADTGGVIVDLPVITVQNGRTVVDFTFAPGAHVDGGGSLIDGRYRLTVEGARVSAFGLNLDGDRDGLGGGNQVFGAQAADRFFRKFGDQNGNNSVDLLDFAEFRRSFGLTSGQERYIASLDSNYNNMIDLLDFAAFRRNFGT